MHALIIEDEQLIAVAIEDILEECGFKSIDFAMSAEAAVKAASRRCPDLITSDVRLRPGCLIEAVQSYCSGAEIPVTFIAGNGADVALRSPCHQLLDKPFSDQALVDAVSAALLTTAQQPSRI